MTEFFVICAKIKSERTFIALHVILAPRNVLKGISKFMASRPPEFPPIFSTRFLRLWRRFWAFMDRTERHTNYPNLFRSTSLIHYLLVIFHWNGCLYHIIYKNNGFGSKNWVFSDSETADVVKQYLQSYYWCTLALTTIGDLPRYLFIYLRAHVTCIYRIYKLEREFTTYTIDTIRSIFLICMKDLMKMVFACVILFV